MADRFQQDELRRLREDLQQLQQRVASLERAQQRVQQPEEELTESSFIPAEPSRPQPDLESESEATPVEVWEPFEIPLKPEVRLPSPEQAAMTSLRGEEQFEKDRRFAPPVEESWESVIGQRWLTWIGSAVLVLAVAYFVPWAWQHFQMPAWLRVAIFHAAGIGLLAGARVLNRQTLPWLSRGIAGLGIFTLYAAAYAMNRHYHLGGELSSALAFGDCAAITLAAILIALRTDSVAVIILGALGGYLTPFIAGSGADDYVLRFVYLAFLNVALLSCAAVRPWDFLNPTAVAATAVLFLQWILSPDFGETHLWGTEWLLTMHAAVLLTGLTIPSVWWKRPSNWSQVAALAGNSVWYAGVTWMLFHERDHQQLAAVCWGMSALHAGLFTWTLNRVTHADPLPRWHLALALLFFTLAIPLQMRDTLDYLAYAWAIEGFVLTAIAVYFADRQMAGAGMVVLGLALIRALAFDFPEAPQLIGESSIDRRFFVTLFSGLITMAAGSAYWWGRRFAIAAAGQLLDTSFGAALLAIGNVVVMISLTRQWDSRLVLVLWALDALAVWVVAIRSKQELARVYAVILSTIFVGGRMLYEGVAVSSPYLCVLNDRFGSLALVALQFFLPSWFYRTRVVPHEQLRPQELGVPTLMHVLGNVVLLGAISMEVNGWFNGAPASLYVVSTAEEVSYSVVWAIYMGVLVAIGFALKYRLPRILGLIGFVVVGLKVFLVDLANLPLILRVLALAALGGMLLVTSFWYQKYFARLNSGDEG